MWFILISAWLALQASNCEAKIQQLPPERITDFIQNIPAIGENAWGEIRAIDAEILPDDALRQEVLIVDIKTARIILNEMVREGYGPMELVAHPFFRSDRRILYFPRATLTLLNKEFYISTPYAAAGRISGGTDNGSYFEQVGILIGRGHVVHLYPSHIRAHRTDGIYQFLTSNYEFYRVNLMDIESTDGTYVLANLRGRDRADESWHPFRGPLNAPIKRMVLSNDRTTVRTSTGVTWWSFPYETYQIINPPLYQQPSQHSGVPEDIAQACRVAAAK